MMSVLKMLCFLKCYCVLTIRDTVCVRITKHLQWTDTNVGIIPTFKTLKLSSIQGFEYHSYPSSSKKYPTHAHKPTPSYSFQTHVLTVPAGQIRRYDSLLERKWHEQDRKQRRHRIHSQVHFSARRRTHTHTHTDTNWARREMQMSAL